MSSAEMPDQAPRNNNIGSDQNVQPFSTTANVSAIALTAALIVFAIKLTMFLPDGYYFSLHSFIGGDNAAPFIISTPTPLTRQQICARAAAKKIKLKTLCWNDNDEASQTPSLEKKEDKQEQPPLDPQAEQKRKELEAQKAQDERLKEFVEQEEEDRQIRAIVAGEPQHKSILALAIRCLIPLIAGAIIFRIYGAAAFPAAGLGAAVAVFVLFWPIVYLWDDLQISDDWKHKKNLFYVMYGAYGILFFYLSRLGAQLASTYLVKYFTGTIEINWTKVVESLIAGLLAGGTIKILEHFIIS